MSIPGADSSTPKPASYPGKKIWAIYVAGSTPHVWTHSEVEELAQHGIEGVLPIVVPPQDVEWWKEGEAGYPVLEALVRDAQAWGVPEESPLCLDIEEHQFEAMGGMMVTVFHAWATATRQHNYRTWSYGSEKCLRNDMWGFKWAAMWPDPQPVNPEVPAGFNAWQYASVGAEGIDLDVFDEGRDFMTPSRGVTVVGVLPGTASVPAESSPTPESPVTVSTGGAPTAAPVSAGTGDVPPDTVTPSPVPADSETPGVVIPPSDVTPPETHTPAEAVSESAPSLIDRLGTAIDSINELYLELVHSEPSKS